jgi:hypothetical protein
MFIDGDVGEGLIEYFTVLSLFFLLFDIFSEEIGDII